MRFLFFPFIFFTLNCFSQSEYPSYLSVEPSLGYHMIFEDDTLLHSYMSGVDISYGYSLQDRSDDWVKFFNAKYIQFAFIYLNLNNLHGFYSEALARQRIAGGLGQHIGMAASLQTQLFRIGKLYSYFLPGYGVSYVTKTYFTHNENNRFIGSHLNFCIRFEFAFEHRLSETLSLTAAFRGVHFSNGGYQVPNAGINSVGGKVGVSYLLR